MHDHSIDTPAHVFLYSNDVDASFDGYLRRVGFRNVSVKACVRGD